MQRDRIRYLAEGYFHQDFDVEFGSADDVLRGFVRRENEGTVIELLAEVHDLLSTAETDVELRAGWDPRDISAFEPSMSGMTYRQWFEHIGEVLNAGSLG